MITKFIYDSIQEFETDNKSYKFLNKTFTTKNLENFYYYSKTDKNNLVLLVKRKEERTINIFKVYAYIFDKNVYDKVIKHVWNARRQHNKYHCCTNIRESNIFITTPFNKIIYNIDSLEYNDDNSHNITKKNVYKKASVFTSHYKQKTLEEQKKLFESQYVKNKSEIRKYRIVDILGNAKVYDYDEFTYLLLVPDKTNVLYKVYIDKCDYPSLVKLNDIRFYIKCDKRKPLYCRYVNFTSELEKSTSLHRFIMKNYLTKDKNMVDHINNNPLDNRRCNLRVVNITENNRNHTVRRNNVSGVTGVRFEPKFNKWLARRTLHEHKNRNPIRVRAMLYDTVEEAVAARKILETITDEEFMSSITTRDLIESKLTLL